MMNLFEEEKILTSTDNNVVVLTTHRIRSNHSIQWGKHSTVSIMLEKISSIQAIYTSYPILLVLGGAMVVWAALVMGGRFSNGAAVALPSVLAIAFFIGYLATKRHICIIASDGGARLTFETSRMDKDVLLKFIDQVEQAKRKRGSLSAINS